MRGTSTRPRTAYEAALVAEPGRVSARRGLAWACEQFERWVQAAEVYRKRRSRPSRSGFPPWRLPRGVWARPAAWLRPRPSSSGCRPSTRRIRRFFSELAWFRQDQGEWLEAIELYRRIEELSESDRADAEEAIGNIYHDRLGDFDKARAAYEAALVAEPGRVERAARVGAGLRGVRALGSSRRSLPKGGRVVRAGAGCRPGSCRRCLGEAGRVAEAEAEFQRLQAEHPQDTQVLFQLAWFRQDQGEWLEAIELYRRIEELSESDRADAEEAIGNIYRDHARDFDKAQAAYEAALAAEPGRVERGEGWCGPARSSSVGIKPPKFTERWQSCPSRSGLPPWRVRHGAWARPAAWLRPRPSSSGCRPSARRIRGFFSN